uniref:Uncharacterized protein n=1 Tax=Fibrocapsa japonica TaxID=94617 RepID=A0A7S2Y364_9STRA|mmetsp:Transcript_435/g.645  ORF Transcript_435/g.645 Transcript_435/m.645 type:complete len:162 (+) Transcript_435:74-559(+)|eukprot:CAMPEP_0113943436 /NCGR_PEP_ID=MMETSP1339-20121228/23742_1 /TAXON_ID=94617 /ORGANISM="Fibrocapsa japonica" /LENGTH=161 /DNA_ID=CAMNT_0000948303 /DNA_START=74 /DNA_END=559 /DNA_ORIENTATION=+ /assembly_acc=CAM_ASM_000762
MVVFILRVKASLENVGQMSVVEGTQWCLKIKNPTGTDIRENVFISDTESYNLPGSRGTAHFTVRWDGARAPAHASLIEVKNVLRPCLTADDSDQWVPVAALECRGLEPIDWSPTENFSVESTGGNNFGVVDLSEGDWADFDDEAGESVSIMEIEHDVIVHK